MYVYIWRDKGIVIVAEDATEARKMWPGASREVQGEPSHVWQVENARKQQLKFGPLQFASLPMEEIW